MAQKQPRLEAIPVKKVRLSADGTLVGFVYQWNNGDLQTKWLGDKRPRGRIYYEDHGNCSASR